MKPAVNPAINPAIHEANAFSTMEALLYAQIPRLRQTLEQPTLEVRINEKWRERGFSTRLKSPSPDGPCPCQTLPPRDGNRRLIRQALSIRTGLDTTDLVDLTGRTPIPRKDGLQFSISISHCRLGGGYALLSKTANGDPLDDIGFDMEDRGRITSRLIARVTSPEERTASPVEALLWGAKEATFKAMRHAEQRPNVLSQILLSDWHQPPPSDGEGKIFTFHARIQKPMRPIRGQGLVLERSNLLFSFFVLERST